MPDTKSPAPNLSLLIRRVHLLAALFLAPWVLMYAVSTLVMHHRSWFTGASERVAPDYEVVEERPYMVPSAGGAAAVASRVLRDLGLGGAFTTSGSLDAGSLTILRDRPLGSYRVTVLNGLVRVERQNLSAPFALEMLHRRRGYDRPVATNDLWAISVDVVIVAILFWVASGVWMWWEMERTRKLGALFAGLGSAAFLVLIVLL